MLGYLIARWRLETKTDGNVTILDVAKRAGVSPSTVTHSLNGKRPVGPGTRERVLRAISDLGYIPSWSAQRLKGGNSGIIGCLAVDITETFVNQIVRGVEKGLVGSNLSLLFASGVEFGNDFDKAYAFLKSHRIDGLLICHHLPVGSRNHLIETMDQVPMVSINMAIDDMISIVPDNILGGLQAAEHLYVSGMRHPAMIGGPEDRLSVIDRLEGFGKRVGELGLDFSNKQVIFGDYSFDHGYEAAAVLMNRFPKIDGLFCANDYIAAGAMTRFTEMGIAVPGQVRVVGFDNRDFSRFWPIPITTFQQPLQDMGLLGMSLLRCAIDSGGSLKTETKHILQSRLVPRASTMDTISYTIW